MNRRTLVVWAVLLPVLAARGVFAEPSGGGALVSREGQYRRVSESAVSALSVREEEKELSLFWAIFLNVAPGFGLGSFLQGNPVAGVIQLGLDGVPIGYATYRAVGIMRDWHPALYVTLPFIVIYAMFVDIWPILTAMGARVFGVAAPLIYHRRSATRAPAQERLSLAVSAGRLVLSYSY